MSEPSIDRHRLGGSLVDRLGDRRWFSAKSSAVVSVDIRGWWPIGGSVVHAIARVETADGGSADYQIPVLDLQALEQRARAHAAPDRPATDQQPLLTDATGRRWVDALAVPEGISAYVPLFVEQARVPAVEGDGILGNLEFHTVSGDFLNADPKANDLRSAALGVEQSNTSVVVGGRILIKFFRRLSSGENPDVEVHRALGTVGCPHVAGLRGWAQATVDGTTTTIAMAQDFLAGAVDGWGATVDGLRSGASDEVSAAAERLGRAVAVVHRDLRRSLGGHESDAADVVAGLSERIDEHIGRVPQLAPYRDRAAALVAEAAGVGPIAVHRVHGDLHLGQVLDVDGRWVVIDFEGEPATDPAARRAPDSPLRDVAGMLRSFDYAAAVAGGGPTATADARRAAEAFCDGYARVADFDPRSIPALLAAYELDKAVYEVDYEARNRPDWIGVPLAAVERILGEQIGG